MLIASYTITRGHHHHSHLSPQVVRNFCSSSSSCSDRHNFRIMIPTIFKFRPLSLTLSRSVAAASFSTRNNINSIENCSNFTWDDVFQISQLPNASSDLGGFFQKINLCNRGSERHSDFIPFVIEDQIVGYVHKGFVDHLSKFKDVFTCIKDDTYGSPSGYVTLQSGLKTPESRTEALENVVKRLGEEVIPAISRYFIIWRKSVFLTGTCCSTLLWD